MTKEEAYNKVKKACIKAVPEIMELKFGCKVLVQTKNAGVQKTVITGRDITLEDVMRAIPIEIELRHEPAALIMRRSFGIKKEPTDWVFWILGKPLHEQPEPTLLFLAELLR